MVGLGRIELPLLSEPEPKSGASTNFATTRNTDNSRPFYRILLVAKISIADTVLAHVINAENSSRKSGVDEGDRTLDRRSHNPELYQLSYVHHIGTYLSVHSITNSLAFQLCYLRCFGTI